MMQEKERLELTVCTETKGGQRTTSALHQEVETNPTDRHSAYGRYARGSD